MSFNKPNRTRTQSVGSNEARRKQSGDQHVMPIDEPDFDQYRPHQLNRQDLQKALPDSMNDSDNDVS